MPYRTGPAALKIIGRVFSALGLTALLIAGALYGARSSELSGRARAGGAVVDFRSTGRSPRPVVEFTTADGRLVRIESMIGSSPPRFHKGEAVQVLYPPAHPEEGLIDEFWSLWFGPVLASIFGVIFTLVGVAMLLGSRFGRPAPG